MNNPEMESLVNADPELKKHLGNLATSFKNDAMDAGQYRAAVETFVAASKLKATSSDTSTTDNRANAKRKVDAENPNASSEEKKEEEAKALGGVAVGGAAVGGGAAGGTTTGGGFGETRTLGDFGHLFPDAEMRSSVEAAIQSPNLTGHQVMQGLQLVEAGKWKPEDAARVFELAAQASGPGDVNIPSVAGFDEATSLAAVSPAVNDSVQEALRNGVLDEQEVKKISDLVSTGEWTEQNALRVIESMTKQPARAGSSQLRGGRSPLADADPSIGAGGTPGVEPGYTEEPFGYDPERQGIGLQLGKHAPRGPDAFGQAKPWYGGEMPLSAPGAIGVESAIGNRTEPEPGPADPVPSMLGHVPPKASPPPLPWNTEAAGPDEYEPEGFTPADAARAAAKDEADKKRIVAQREANIAASKPRGPDDSEAEHEPDVTSFPGSFSLPSLARTAAKDEVARKDKGKDKGKKKPMSAEER
jgi:hypothetical protein